MAHIIVLGNEKGGSGKSTTAMHLMSAIARSGYKVGAIDLDLRQQSFFRYIDNREAFCVNNDVKLPLPKRVSMLLSSKDSQKEAQAEEELRFAEALSALEAECDFILIDCPGAHTRYAQMAHSVADTLITPMNDSLVDFDLLARLDPATGKVLGPSIYSEMVWSARQLRSQAGLKSVDWVVLRNRMSTLNARNKRKVGTALDELSTRIGFRLISGFSERVVFRELFLNGLTLLDLKDVGNHKMTLSNIAARQEVRDLIRALKLPDVTINF
ncbi:MAG: division plane positioning ATPase MipZ [Paracoccaceae bacterium]